MKYKAIQLLFVLLTFQTLINAQEESSLHDLLSDTNCESTCWLGIEIGHTTEGELHYALASNVSAFHIQRLGLEGDLTYFEVVGYKHSLVDPNISIAIYAGTGGSASSIQIPLTNVDVNTVIATFGYPDKIVERQARFLVYLEEGIVFGLPQNTDMIFDVNILGTGYTGDLYIDQTISGSPYQTVSTDNCLDASELCIIINDTAINCHLNILSGEVPSIVSNLISGDNAGAINSVCPDDSSGHSDPVCLSSCWLGIEPGVTTEEEVESILDSYGISYEKNLLGADGSTAFFYNVTGGYSHPLVNDDSILIHGNHGIIDSISISLQFVEVNQVISGFGNPTNVLHDGIIYSMIYNAENLAFGVGAVGIDKNYAFNLLIMNADVLELAYLNNSIWDNVNTCTDHSQLCDVVAAISPSSTCNIIDQGSIASLTTTTATESNENAINNICAEDNIFSSDLNCNSSRWVGIEPGVTTEEQVESILNSYDITYEKHPLGAEGSTSFFYAVTGGYFHPLIMGDSVLVNTNQGVVTSIDMLLETVEINDMIAEYGNPTNVLQVGRSFEIIYDTENLAFGVIEADKNSVFNLSIMSDEILNLVYLDSPRWDELETCTDANQLCDVVASMSP